MGNKCWRSLVVLSILLFAAVARCSSQDITKSQATDAVKTFEGDQNLQLSASGIESVEDPLSASGSQRYYFVKGVATPSPRTYWRVDAGTGEVLSALYGTRFPSTDSDTPYGSYTQAQCRDIALAYAQAKYDSFDTMGFQLTADRWDGGGWIFGWEQIIAYGARTSNFVRIDVSSTTGLIQSYGSSRYPVYSPQQAPTVSSQQAVQLAADGADIVTLDSNDQPDLEATGTSLVWSVHVVGEDAQDNCLDVFVELDAYSGDILAIYSPGGGVTHPGKGTHVNEKQKARKAATLSRNKNKTTSGKATLNKAKPVASEAKVKKHTAAKRDFSNTRGRSSDLKNSPHSTTRVKLKTSKNMIDKTK